MAYIEKTVHVARPVRAVYDQRTQFEEFPRFMIGVREVRQVDDRHVRWRAEIAGVEEEWVAEITHQEPDRRIAWTNTAGPHNAGLVTFTEEDGGTRVRLRLEYTPRRVVEKLGDVLGLVGRRVEANLERFKAYVEARGATGAWRGRINDPHDGGAPGRPQD